MLNLSKIGLIVCLTAVLGACSTTSLDSNKVASVDVSSQAGYDPINDPKSSVYGKRSIYFDFDSYTVKPEYQSVISAHAQYLRANKDKTAGIAIQGNTDERGTTEYNLALGQRRSEAVKKALVLLGVDQSQLEAVSFGKEKPKASGSNEEAWKENRRADIVYK
jgi:peptidoglycan-associated lipoprotein